MKKIFVIIGVASICAVILAGLLSNFRFDKIFFPNATYPSKPPITYSIDIFLFITGITTVFTIIIIVVRFLLKKLNG